MITEELEIKPSDEIILSRVDLIKNKVKKNRFIKSSVNLVGRVIGIVNTIVIIKFLGTGKDVDNFVLAYALYNYLFNLVSPIIEAQATASLNSEGNPENLLKSVSFSTKLIIIPISIIFLFLFIKFNYLYALICLSIITSNYVSFYFGYATHKERWNIIFISNLLRLVMSAGIIICTFKYLGIYSAIWGILIGDLIKFIFLQKKFAWIKHGETADNDFNKQVTKQLPSHVLNGLTPVINRYVTFYLGIPQIIFLDLAEKIYSGVTLIFAHVFIPPKFNDWSASYLEDKRLTSRRILNTSLVVGIIALAFSILLFLIFRSLKGLQKIELLTPTMFYFLGLGPYLSTLILVKLLILHKKTHVLSVVSVIQIILNIICSLIFVPFWGLSGVGFSVSISSTLTTALLWIYSLKKCN